MGQTVSCEPFTRDVCFLHIKSIKNIFNCLRENAGSSEADRGLSCLIQRRRIKNKYHSRHGYKKLLRLLGQDEMAVVETVTDPDPLGLVFNNICINTDLNPNAKLLLNMDRAGDELI